MDVASVDAMFSKNIEWRTGCRRGFKFKLTGKDVRGPLNKILRDLHGSLRRVSGSLSTQGVWTAAVRP